ncbi:MAG: DUF87 domain-containing protein [Candidatus Nanohaloarchaea archaeon]|nr:DUF87 domain-containing protein [Candidatus Nanohaloarchaea archaeon]
MLVGELEGEVSTDRLTFEAFKEVEKFDFVTVKNPKEGQEWILAQVDTVVKQQDGKTEAEAQVIGYREDGLLKQPRHVVDPDAMVYRADESVIAETLGLTQDGLELGRLDTNPDIRIFLDPEDLYKHIAVLAKTGAGKSYFTGVMIEELLENDYPVVIIDPHGEYHSLAEANDIDSEDAERYDVSPQTYPVTEYSTNVEVNPAAEKLSFASTDLDATEIEQMVPTNLTNAQLEVLYNALNDLEKRDTYTLEDVIDRCMEGDSKAKWNLVNVLELVNDSNLFEGEPTPLDEFLTAGEASIVNLKGEDPEMQELVVYKLAKELFERRKRGELEPFVMVMEEAHNFVPERNFGKAVCSDILRTIASEGRKFGLGIGVVSQRPARVDKNVLSQCNTQFILRVTNPNDLNAISRSFEGVTSEVKEFITSLPPGTGLLLGKEYPVMTDVRTRRSLHGGETKELSADTADASEPEAESSSPAPDTGGLAETPQAGPEDAGPASPQETPSPAVSAQGEHGDDASLQRIVPAMGLDELEETGDATAAYYPIYVVETSEGVAAVDGTDGEVKGVEPRLDGTAGDALQMLKRGDRTSGELLDALDVGIDELEEAMQVLAEHGLIGQDGDQYTYSGFPGFVREQEEIPPGEDRTIIETELDSEDAMRAAVDAVGGSEESADTIYYPYYTVGTRVFDAVRAEEV